jgi:hypothetical protein
MNETDDEQYHHGKPHGYMEMEVADRFIQNEELGNIQQKTTDDRVGQ